MGCWGAGGLSTSLQLLWPPGSSDRYCPGPGWFQLAIHTLAALHSVGGLWFLLQGPQCLLQAGKPCLANCLQRPRVPRACMGGEVRPTGAPSSSGLPQSLGPSQQGRSCPRRRLARRESFCWCSPGTLGSSWPWQLRGADLPDKWAEGGPDQDG